MTVEIANFVGMLYYDPDTEEWSIELGGFGGTRPFPLVDGAWVHVALKEIEERDLDVIDFASAYSNNLQEQGARLRPALLDAFPE